MEKQPEPGFGIEKLMKDIIKFADEKLGGSNKNSFVSVDVKTKLIGYENSVKKPINEKSEQETMAEIEKDRLKLEFLIDTCGDQVVENIVNQLEELFAKHSNFKNEAKVMIDNMLEETKQKSLHELTNLAKKDKYRNKISALEEITSIFY